MRLSVGVIFSLLCTAVFGKPCSNLLTTSFGFRGPWTAYLNSDAIVTIVKDGFTTPIGDEETAADHRMPRLRTERRPLSAFLRQPRSFASLPASLGEGAYYATVSNAGQLSLTLPDGQTYPFQLKDRVRAATFYRPPIIEAQIKALKSGRFGAEASRREFVELSQQAERLIPARLYYSARRTIFSVRIRSVGIQGQNESLRNLARTHITRVEMGSDGEYLSWLPSPVRWLDFESELNAKYRVLIPTAEADVVVEVSKPIPVFTFDSEQEMESIDFLRAVDVSRLVAASTLGQVAVVDITQSKVTDRPSFPGVAFIGSLSAHRNGKTVDVWAVDSAKHSLLRWNSSFLSGQFQPVVEFPADADPFQVASFSSRVPIGFELGVESPRGYFTNIREPIPEQPRIEQVLVQDQSGRIHALRDRPLNLELEPEQKWESPPTVP